MPKDGTVYTRKWVVEMMLDLAGYTSDRDLASLRVVEPSFGEGAFLVPLAKRLLESIRKFSRPVSYMYDSVRAYEISPDSIHATRAALTAFFISEGLSGDEIENCLSAWLLQSDYLLSPQADDVDLVIGNPPYVRSNDMSEELKHSYMQACSTMTPGSDMFVGFIEKGLSTLKDGGVLSYICADRWMHNTYGKKLRNYVTSSFSVDDIIVMHDVDAFDREVSAYPAITVISNSAQGKVHYSKADASFSPEDAKDYVSWRTTNHGTVDHCECSILDSWFSGAQLWPLSSPAKLKLIEKLERDYPPLEDPKTGTKVGIGVATGKDSVFVVSDQSIAENERLVPIITSRQLNRGKVSSGEKWLVNPWDDDGNLVSIEEYPQLKQYFMDNEKELKDRQIARKGRPKSWYRTIDKVRPGLADTPKLLVQDMHARFEPHYDNTHYPHGNLYYITSEKWDLEVLGGLLMSSICEAFIDAYGVKMRGGTLRFQAQYLRTIRVPMIDSLDVSTAEQLKVAFRTKDYGMADDAAAMAYGIGR